MKHAQNKSGNKKRVAAIVAVLCLALAGGLATYAWLTNRDTLTNNFTTAGINDPTHDPDPDDPTKPDENEKDLDSNLFETKWVQDSKLVIGDEDGVAKNPNVGLGAGSEASYVYLNVQNKTMKDGADASHSTYFVVDTSKWKAVDATPFTGARIDNEGADKSAYTGGLFVYTGADNKNATPLSIKNDQDTFTGELFTHVYVPAETEKEDLVEVKEGSKPQMDVTSYIYASKDGATGEASGSATAAENWVKGQMSSATQG